MSAHYSKPLSRLGKCDSDVRLKEMKKALTSLAIFICIIATQSGCMCVHSIKTAGTHSRNLKSTAVWTNSNGRVMIECSVIDTSSLPQNSRNLGTRFVCASPETWKRSITSEVDKLKNWAQRKHITNRVEHIYLHIMISESATNEYDLFTGGFVLFPSDITRFQDYALPSNAGVRCKPPENSNQTSFLFDVDNQQIKVYVGNIVMPTDMRKYKDWWWYPNQVFLIPAYAIDIVTSPIQFLIAMNSLSKIDN